MEYKTQSVLVLL